MSWTATRTVEFAHCDPAGIVFYPRYFEMINSVIEEFFAAHVNHPFAKMIFQGKNGMPTAQISVSFLTPGHLGDELAFSLHFPKVGTSSATLNMNCAHQGQTRFTVEQVLVRTDLSTGKSSPWPADIAEKLKSA